MDLFEEMGPHPQEIDIDVLVGLQRCRGPTVDKAMAAMGWAMSSWGP